MCNSQVTYNYLQMQGNNDGNLIIFRMMTRGWNIV